VSFAVKEIFYTLQGEGARSGRPAVLLRFAGCNLWNGRESSRATAICSFCDTDFVGADGPGGGRYRDASTLVDAVESRWPGATGRRYVVCTGGEPALQLDEDLIAELHTRDFEVAIETNGTRPLPDGLDWVCVSPKAGTDVVVTHGDELKVVIPQDGLDLGQLATLEFASRYLQPLDDEHVEEHIAEAVHRCLEDPRWSLSIQQHKVVGLR